VVLLSPAFFVVVDEAFAFIVTTWSMWQILPTVAPRIRSVRVTLTEPDTTHTWNHWKVYKEHGERNPSIDGLQCSERKHSRLWWNFVHTYVFPVFERLGVRLCFLIGIEVLASSFRDTVVTVDLEVGDCVHLNDVKNTMN
jgi:hypothetical protein